jgi:predicted PurR-regulated permease PerM
MVLLGTVVAGWGPSTALLSQLVPILVVVITAFILVGTLAPFVGLLKRHGVNRYVAIFVVFIACAAVIGLGGLVTIPALFAQVARVLLNLETIVGGYLRGQVITSIAIGVFIFGLMSILQVPNAVALPCSPR